MPIADFKYFHNKLFKGKGISDNIRKIMKYSELIAKVARKNIPKKS